ncbi:MAG: hypothetical protein U0228_06155 [Myxococcaceae bacterium]
MTFAPLLVGLALGMRHALEPDHLAALSTLATESRGGARAGFGLGALWGLGHTLALLAVAGSLAVVGAQMPPAIEAALELSVAVMIFALGIRALRRAWREGRTGQVHTHAHGDLAHTHAAPPAHVHVRDATLATRPLLIGLMHGLAGSGALTALVIAELPTLAERLGYIALFGAGSVVGMGLLAGLAGNQLTRWVRRPAIATALLFVTGACSALLGLAWGHTALQGLLG